MLSLFTYEDARRLTEERQRRALEIYEAKRTTANDSYFRAQSREADVIELAFVTDCPDSIGA
jgi:hypothetical protein